MPAVDEVEQRLAELRSPAFLAPRQMERCAPRQPQRVIRLRQRLLTLPVIVAIVVSLVWRRMPAVTEVQRVLAREGVLWVPPMRVSVQALSTRLDGLPAAVMGQRFAEVCAPVQAQAPPALPPPRWVPVREACLLPERPCGRLDPGSTAHKDAGVTRAPGSRVGGQDAGEGGSLQSSSAVAALYRRRRSP